MFRGYSSFNNHVGVDTDLKTHKYTKRIPILGSRRLQPALGGKTQSPPLRRLKPAATALFQRMLRERLN